MDCSGLMSLHEISVSARWFQPQCHQKCCAIDDELQQRSGPPTHRLSISNPVGQYLLYGWAFCFVCLLAMLAIKPRASCMLDKSLL